jgi:hypothetical protein
MSDSPLTPFQQEWHEYSARFGLRVEIPYRFQIGDHEVEVPVLLRDFGAARGMLLVTDYSQIEAHTQWLIENGYGFSCLSEPGPKYPGDDEALER